jgi:hypothetical protein
MGFGEAARAADDVSGEPRSELAALREEKVI